MYSNKSISPVVATALLLVVAVVAVIGFQTWYQTYSSSILSNIENRKLPNNIQVEGIINENLYLSSSREDTLTLFKIEDLSGNLMCEYNPTNKEFFNYTKLILSLDSDTYNGTNIISNNINLNVIEVTQEDNCISEECFYFDYENNNTIIAPTLNEDVLLANENTSWSIYSWFKNSGELGENQAIIAKSGGTGSYATFVIYLYKNDLSIRIRGNRTNFKYNFEENIWHFVAITWDGEKAFAYFDLETPVELGIGNMSDQYYDDFSIGAANGGTNCFFEGYIDEIGFYENVALNRNEVNALYNLRKAVPYEQILIDGVRKINISNCNLTTASQYNFVGFTDTQTIQQIFTMK